MPPAALAGPGAALDRPQRHLRSPEGHRHRCPLGAVSSARSGWRSGTAEESPSESGRTGRTPTFAAPFTVTVL